MHFWEKSSRNLWELFSISGSWFIIISLQRKSRKYSKFSLSSLKDSMDALLLSLLQNIFAFSLRRDKKRTQASFLPITKSWESPGRLILLAKAWISGCICYLRELGVSTRDLFFKERKTETGKAPDSWRTFNITASAASHINDPGKTDIRTKESYLSLLKRSKDVLIVIRTDFNLWYLPPFMTQSPLLTR